MKIKDKKFWKDGPGSIALAILLALTIRWAFIEPYVIPSGSMLPTLLIHDHIFVNKIVYGLRFPFSDKWIYKTEGPKRGDVIVFKYPVDGKTAYVKRVIGLPGDKVFYENGNLYINDELIEKDVPEGQFKKDFSWLRDEDFKSEGPGAKDLHVHWEENLKGVHHSILNRESFQNMIFGPYQVPPDHYFVMGDHRDNSNDSRYWPPDKRFVPRDLLLGRAMFVWLSCDEMIPFIPFLCDPLTIRWSRLFHKIK